MSLLASVLKLFFVILLYGKHLLSLDSFSLGVLLGWLFVTCSSILSFFFFSMETVVSLKEKTTHVLHCGIPLERTCGIPLPF